MTKEAYLKLIEDQKLRRAAVKAIAAAGWPDYARLMGIDASNNKLPKVTPELLATPLKPRKGYQIPRYVIDKTARTSQAEFEYYGPYTVKQVRAAIAIVRGFRNLRLDCPTYPPDIQEMRRYLLALDDMRLPTIKTL